MSFEARDRTMWSWYRLESWIHRLLRRLRGPDRPTGRAEAGTPAPDWETSDRAREDTALQPVDDHSSDDADASMGAGTSRDASEPEVPTPRPQAAPLEETAPALESIVRIGVDFGTSTTHVAVRIGAGEPYLIPLEPGLDYMPSFLARLDGEWRFGVDAANLPQSVHSLKPRLVKDLPLIEYPEFRASDGAAALLAEVAARTIKYLKTQRLIPEGAVALEVATQLGTTPRFDLSTRVLVRDVAQRAGLNVRLTDLVEEPVSAAFELVYGAVALDGRIMVVDIGGGTLDIAVIRSDLAAASFELFATRGADTAAGDRFTEVIADLVTAEAAHLGAAVPLDRRSETALWNRAEAAKLALSTATQASVPLGGIGGLDGGQVMIDGDSYDAACGSLRAHLKNEIREAYYLARLVLDRGGADDVFPGTLSYKRSRNGGMVRLSEVPLEEDAAEHLDQVVAVGGGSFSPQVQRVLRELFGQLLRDPPDPVGAVALGLARGTRLGVSNLRYPNWGISARFRSPDGEEVPMYEPFAPTLRFRPATDFATYQYTADIPPGAKAVEIIFREVGARAQSWPAEALPEGADRLRLGLDLFGRVNLQALGPGGASNVIGRDRRAPWMPKEGSAIGPWMPKTPDREWYAHVPQWSWDDVG
jgi:Hsp70 protein